MDYTCWDRSADIQAWIKGQGLAGSEGAYEYFVGRTAEITREQHRVPVQWVEVFEHFGANLSKDVSYWPSGAAVDAESHSLRPIL